jgi:hypothetical protein
MLPVGAHPISGVMKNVSGFSKKSLGVLNMCGVKNLWGFYSKPFISKSVQARACWEVPFSSLG